ncbi:MAG: hypothetical protein KBC57_04650 [Neisseriaceae bacterium]|nr:hypothetical protein [Neisseriaceae bacterium]
MTPLNHYIQAIMGQASPAVLIQQSHEREREAVPEGTIETRTSHYAFADGVQLQEEREDFYPTTNAPIDEASCPPCTIDYRVTQHGQQTVYPASKRFHNECQRLFWVAVFHLPT